MDQLIKLGKAEAKETLLDLFLNSMVDLNDALVKNLCRRLKYTKLEQCLKQCGHTKLMNDATNLMKKLNYYN